MLGELTSQEFASWIFGVPLLIFVMWLIVFGPKRIPLYRGKLVALIAALLSGLFAYFLTGSIFLQGEPNLPGWGKFVIQASGGFALFITVLLWWRRGDDDDDREVKEITQRIGDVKIEGNHNVVKQIQFGDQNTGQIAIIVDKFLMHSSEERETVDSMKAKNQDFKKGNRSQFLID